MKLAQTRYHFCIQTVKSLHSNNRLKIFSSESVKQRIDTFRHMKHHECSDQESNQQDISIPSILNPSYLKFDTAKNLSQYIKTNRIPSNIRILHALAHIEYNAFMAYTHTYFSLSSQIKEPQMQQLFKTQIQRIALDQGDHFCLLNDRLQTLGWSYGALPVIDQLCLAINQTKVSLIQRIARISLLHEGKGMNAIRKLISQLQKEKDEDSIRILKLIEKQQVYHFENGVKWFVYMCGQENKNVDETLQELIQRKEFKNLGIQDIRAVMHKNHL